MGSPRITFQKVRLTERELNAQEVFDKALAEAWEIYNRKEHPAMLERQEAILAAYKDFQKAIAK